MSASLNIHIIAEKSRQVEEISFFNADEWTNESEVLLMQRVYELMNLTRRLGKKLCLHIEIEVSDMAEISFLIKKKIGTACEINTSKLTIREIEILGMIMQGMTNNEIAEKLFISYETVKSHRKHILLKTAAKNTAALINYYHHTFFEK